MRPEGEYSDKKTVRFVGQIVEEKQYQKMHDRQYDRYAERILFSDLTDAFEGNFGGLLDWNCAFQMKRLYELLTGKKINICRLNPGPEEMTVEMMKEEMAESADEMLSYLEQNDIDARELEVEMKELIFQFLSDRRLSVFDEEEAFVKVMVQLKRAIRKAQGYAEELREEIRRELTVRERELKERKTI